MTKETQQVTHIKGNLLDFPAGITTACHCANAFCTMGGGIAKEVRERFPEAYEADCKTESGDKNKMGKFTYAKVGGKYIVNLYGQYNFGTGERQVNYEYLSQAIEKVYDSAVYHNKKEKNKDNQMVIGFPKLMGCGLAGGDWEIVQSIIENYAKKYSVKTYIVNFNG